MRQQLMYLTPITDSDFVDTLDDKPYVFELDTVDNPLDADDPETALHDYLTTVFARH